MLWSALKILVYINFFKVIFLPDKFYVGFENSHAKLQCFGVCLCTVLLPRGKTKKKHKQTTLKTV